MSRGHKPPLSPDKYSEKELDDLRPISPPTSPIGVCPRDPLSHLTDSQETASDFDIRTPEPDPDHTPWFERPTEPGPDSEPDLQEPSTEHRPAHKIFTESAAIRIEQESIRKNKVKKRKIIYKCKVCYFTINGKKEPREFESNFHYQAHLRSKKHKTRLSNSEAVFCKACNKDLKNKHDFDEHVKGKKHRVKVHKLKQKIKF